MPNDTTPPPAGDVRFLAGWLRGVATDSDWFMLPADRERMEAAAAALERLAGERDEAVRACAIYQQDIGCVGDERDAERAARERAEAALREIAEGTMEGWTERKARAALQPQGGGDV